jgi:hypothetical protein
VAQSTEVLFRVDAEWRDEGFANERRAVTFDKKTCKHDKKTQIRFKRGS